MSNSIIEKNVTDYMISENETSSNAIKAAENIMNCKFFIYLFLFTCFIYI